MRVLTLTIHVWNDVFLIISITIIIFIDYQIIMTKKQKKKNRKNERKQELSMFLIDLKKGKIIA